MPTARPIIKQITRSHLPRFDTCRPPFIHVRRRFNPSDFACDTISFQRSIEYRALTANPQVCERSRLGYRLPCSRWSLRHLRLCLRLWRYALRRRAQHHSRPVQRADGTTQDIAPVSAGGISDGAAQDLFCSGATCLISIIYDQSGNGNDLTQAPPGDFLGPEEGGYDSLADATAAPVSLSGSTAYGVFVSPSTGYSNNAASGIAVGDEPQGIYAVLDGTHYNDGCCFDYGNAETNSRNTGNGHMETIYFGNNRIWGTGDGDGPWIMADMENGLFTDVRTGYIASPVIT